MVDMRVKIGNVALKNPIMPASGCFSTDLAQVIDLNRLGALVAKTVSREFRAGNPPPRVSEVKGGNFALHEEHTFNVMSLIRKTTDKPIWCKLSPNAGDVVAIAKAAEAAGADALVVSNTILGLKIDVNSFRPAIGNKFGGLSGPGIKPIIVRMVYQCAKAVKIPIIGCGGIVKVEDVVEYML